MEMDGGTALVGLISLVLCALPFVLDHRSRSRMRKEQLAALQAIAAQHNCNVDHHESCGHAVLGLDTSRNALFYCDLKEGGAAAQFVDLSLVRSCHAVKASRSAAGKGDEAVMDRVELDLQHKDKSRDPWRLVLYRAGSDHSLNGEIQFADKWVRKINERVKAS